MPRKRSVPQEPHNPSTPDNGGVNEPGYDAQLAARFMPALAIIPGRALTDDKLSPFEFRVFALMCGHANREDRECWPKQETLALELGTDKYQISRAANRLAELGYIRIERQRYPRTNHYFVLFEQPAKPPAQVPSSCARTQLQVAPERNYKLRQNATKNSNIEQVQRTGTYSSIDNNRHIQATPQSGARERVRQETDGDAERNAEERPAITRDPLWLALVACLGIEPTPRTRAFGKWTTAVNDLRRQGATAADIPRAISAYQSAYPRADVTPLGIADNWPRIREGKSHDAKQLEIAQRTLAAKANTSDARTPHGGRHGANSERDSAEQREIERMLREWDDEIRQRESTNG